MVDFNDTGIEMITSIDTHLWPMIDEAATPLREKEVLMGNYASSIEKLMTCMLRSYFDRVDKIDEDFSHLNNTFAHGNAIHSMLVDMFKRAGIWRGDEVRGSNPAFNISYRIDALIADPTNGGEIVPVEIKSVKASSWAMTKDEPFLSHYLQLQIYMHFHQPQPYPYGYLLYYNKNTDQVRFYTVKYDPLVCAAMEKAMEELEWRVAANEQPSPAESMEPCKWCQYKCRCFEGGENDE